MIGVDIAGLAMVGVGLLMTAVGLLRGMIAVSPIVAYSAGQVPEASARAAQNDPRRVFWTRVLIAGLVATMVGLALVNAGSPSAARSRHAAGGRCPRASRTWTSVRRARGP